MHLPCLHSILIFVAACIDIYKQQLFLSPPWTHRLVVRGGNAARADGCLLCIAVRAAANESAP
jgi:hypothetical protein